MRSLSAQVPSPSAQARTPAFRPRSASASRSASAARRNLGHVLFVLGVGGVEFGSQKTQSSRAPPPLPRLPPLRAFSSSSISTRRTGWSSRRCIGSPLPGRHDLCDGAGPTRIVHRIDVPFFANRDIALKSSTEFRNVEKKLLDLLYAPAG
jgi:hypothetical protein